MPGKKINITGTSGRTYNLDELQRNTRDDSSSALVVQIWEWNPNLPAKNAHSKPNPPKPEVGQIWLSKLVETDGIAYNNLLYAEDPDTEEESEGK